MKLSKDQIHFIDTYLKNSEIAFVDVRMEMMDHVASEVEAKMEAENLDFYNAFKNHMVVHKKEYQKANKKFTKTTDIKVLKEIGRFLIKPSTVLILISCFALLKTLASYFDITSVLRVAPVALLISLSVFYFISYRSHKKERFSGLERIGMLLMLFTQLLQIFFSPNYQTSMFADYQNTNILFVSFLLVLSLGFIQLVFKYKKEYASLYKNNLA